jgi:hypothetical protein
MNVLIACEESQEVCKAFRAKGHEAFSCDLQECSGGHPEWHIQDDVKNVLYTPKFTNSLRDKIYSFRKWDLVISHPVCTRLANSGVRWLSSRKERAGYSWSRGHKVYLRDDPGIWQDLQKGIEFVNYFIDYGKEGNRIAIEQPVHHKYAISGLHDNWTQSIQPYMFGDMATKETHLFLYGLPELKETNNVYDEMMKLPYGERARVHYASPGPERSKLRSKTYPGIAQAMAEQWG